MKTCNWYLAAGMLAQAALWAQNSAPAPSYTSDEYLLLGDATRGAGEPMIAMDPTNPNNIVLVAMGNLQRLGGKATTSNMTNAFHAVADSTINVAQR
jgi:hypothetical protein